MSGLPPWGNSRRKRGLTPEGYVKQAIRKWCGLKRWLLVPVPAGVTSMPGSPDYFLGANGHWYAVEVKRSTGGRLSPVQLAFQQECLRLKIPYLVVDDVAKLANRIEGKNSGDWGATGVRRKPVYPIAGDCPGV